MQNLMKTVDKALDDGKELNNNSPSCNPKDRLLVPIASIKKSDLFVKLFPINNDILEGISNNMKEFGYDAAQPLTIWQNRPEGPCLIDGHTRFAASQMAGLETVWVNRRPFKDFDSAREYSEKRDHLRRHRSEGDKLKRCYEMIKIKPPKNQIDFIMKHENIKKTNAGKWSYILNNCNDVELEKVFSGEITTNKMYKKKTDEKKPKSEKTFKDKKITVGDVEKNLLKIVLENPQMSGSQLSILLMTSFQD